MKTEVYSWRVSTDVKTELGREARRRSLSVSKVLDLAAREWLSKNSRLHLCASSSEARAASDDEEERRLRSAAVACFGALASDRAHRWKNTRKAARQRLRRYER
jgi:hypothetical protein